jgi:hypothetical protein
MRVVPDVRRRAMAILPGADTGILVGVVFAPTLPDIPNGDA